MRWDHYMRQDSATWQKSRSPSSLLLVKEQLLDFAVRCSIERSAHTRGFEGQLDGGNLHPAALRSSLQLDFLGFSERF